MVLLLGARSDKFTHGIVGIAGALENPDENAHRLLAR
jgi:hypothetical protein